MASERLIAGRPVGRVGLGVQLLAASTDRSLDDLVRVIHAALDGGVRLLDTSDVYAPNCGWTGQGERLVGEALRRWPGDKDRLTVATKGGHILGAHPQDITRDGRPAHLRAACEASLKALGVEAIDLYQLHSVDPQVPLADSVGALADLQRAGKIRHIGLSNIGRRQLTEAQQVAPIASVQNRLSVLSLESLPIASFCEQSGVAFLCYSPLGRLDAPNLGARLAPLQAVADRLMVSPQRVALAWLVAQGANVIPLPGATTEAQALDNLAAGELVLSADDPALIGAAASG